MKVFTLVNAAEADRAVQVAGAEVGGGRRGAIRFHRWSGGRRAKLSQPWASLHAVHLA